MNGEFDEISRQSKLFMLRLDRLRCVFTLSFFILLSRYFSHTSFQPPYPPPSLQSEWVLQRIVTTVLGVVLGRAREPTIYRTHCRCYHFWNYIRILLLIHLQHTLIHVKVVEGRILGYPQEGLTRKKYYTAGSPSWKSNCRWRVWLFHLPH